MLGDDRPAQRVWIGPEWRDDPRQGDWRGYFDDVVDVICPDAQSRGPRYGYGAGPRADADQDAREGGRHVARHGKGRRGSGNRNGVAALTAAAVVGTGVSAGVLGVVPFMAPTTTAPGVTTSAHAPAAASARGSGASAQNHVGYVGKHRKAPAAPSSAPAHLGTQAGTSPAGSAPSSALTYAPTSPSSAAASHQGGTSSSSASSSAAAGHQASPQSSSPAPQGGSGSSTGSGSGTPASTATTSGGGSTSSSSSSGGQGLVGGVVGGVTGLVGGLLG